MYRRSSLLALMVSAALAAGCASMPPATPTPLASDGAASPGASMSLVAPPSATPSPSPSDLPTPAARLGAGLRYSTYGATVSNPAYWVGAARRMAAKFPGSVPQAIWIVSNVNGQGTQLTFPGGSTDPLINYSIRDRNEAALKLFDEAGGEVWLQLEPGHAPVEQLIDIVLTKYGGHPSVIGIGVDVEWHRSVGNTPEGEPVTDELARSWVAAVRRHDPAYPIFVKHWDADWLPPTERDGLVFVDDSQEHGSMVALVAEFEAWGKRFAPSPVGYQYGYSSDERWWKPLADPAAEIGNAILSTTPNTAGLYWVDFTALAVFPER